MPRRLLLASLLLAFSAAPLLRAQTPLPPDFHADQLDFDLSTSEAVGQGNARLNYQGGLLTADRIRFNQRTQTAIAEGNVVLTRGTQRLLAESIVYRLVDKHIEVRGLRMGDFPLYLSADEISGNETTIVATNATLSYHDPRLRGPRLKARSITYEPGRSISADGAQIGIGKFQPVTVGRYNQRVDDPVLNYLEFGAGYRNSLGAFLELGAHLPVFEGVWIGADLNSYTKRGFLVGPSGEYKIATGQGLATGKFRTGYINDSGDRFTDTLGRPIDNKRGFAEWSHFQKVNDRLTVYGEINYWSDSEITRDFRPDDFYPVQQPDSFLEATYTLGNGVVSLFTRVQPNSYFRVQQRLPELRYDLLPSALPKGFYHRAQVSAAVLSQKGLAGEAPQRTNRFDAYYGLDRPITPQPWFTFKPVAGARFTQYSNNSTGRSEYSRGLAEIGFDASLRGSGKFNYKNDLWKIDGLRHLVEPRVSYRYIPSADKGQAYIPAIDDEVFMTYLRPLGLGEQRAIDRLQPMNTVRIGLDNTLQTRDGKYGSRDLVRLNLAADLHLERFNHAQSHSDLHSELVITPAKWLAFTLYQRVDPEDLTLRELNTGLMLIDGNQWNARISSHYLQGQIEEYVLDGGYRLNEVYRLEARIHYDSFRSRFVEESFGLIHNIDNLWRVRYAVSLYNGSRRESNFGFNINVELVGF